MGGFSNGLRFANESGHIAYSLNRGEFHHNLECGEDEIAEFMSNEEANGINGKECILLPEEHKGKGGCQYIGNQEKDRSNLKRFRARMADMKIALN